MIRVWFRRLFGVAGAVFLVWGVTRAWREGIPILAASGMIVPVVAISIAGIVGASYSWTALFPRSINDSRSLRAAFFGSQVGKHLPLGGLGQALGQAELSASVLSRRGASLGVIIHAIVQITAALLVCGGVAFIPHVPAWWRWPGIAAIMGAIALLIGGERRLARWGGRRLKVRGSEVPPQAALIRSTVLCLIPILASALSFSLLAHSIEPAVGVITGIPLFAIGWLAGYLAIPFPAGLGVREAVLVAIFDLPLSVIMTASVAQRLVTLGVEGMMALVAWRFLPKGVS